MHQMDYGCSVQTQRPFSLQLAPTDKLGGTSLQVRTVRFLLLKCNDLWLLTNVSPSDTLTVVLDDQISITFCRNFCEHRKLEIMLFILRPGCNAETFLVVQLIAPRQVYFEYLSLLLLVLV